MIMMEMSRAASSCWADSNEGTEIASYPAAANSRWIDRADFDSSPRIRMRSDNPLGPDIRAPALIRGYCRIKGQTPWYCTEGLGNLSHFDGTVNRILNKKMDGNKRRRLVAMVTLPDSHFSSCCLAKTA